MGGRNVHESISKLIERKIETKIGPLSVSLIFKPVTLFNQEQWQTVYI